MIKKKEIQDLKLQYTMALDILAETVENYDESLWHDQEYSPWTSWQIACHALFYVNAHLAPDPNAVAPWPEYRKQWEILGETPWPPDEIFIPEGSYTQEEILDFIGHIKDNLETYLEGLHPAEPCWHHWFDGSQMEFQKANLSHLQHHIDALSIRHIANRLECGCQ